LRGDKRKGVILDEYADMNPYTFDAIEPSLGDEKGYCWFVGTPKGKDHFYARFIRDDIYFDSVFAKEYEIIYQKILEVDRNYKSYKFKTEDNPYFPKESIEQARKNLTLEYFRQEYEASFENYTGLIYREFLEFKNELILEPIIRQNIVIGCKKKREIIKNNKLEIIIDEIIFKDYWHYYSGLDTGRINACLFLSIDEEGNEYWYEELYLIDTLVEENAEKIKNKMTKRNFLANTIDSASQVKNEYRARGINFTDSQKDVLGSIEMMRGKMKNRKMFILSNCKAFINELSNRKWSENKTQTINGKRKPIPEPGNDHCCNAAEYINLTFLKYPQKIITPFIKNYEKSLESLVINQEISNWKEKG
jgi:transcriptional regulator